MSRPREAAHLLGQVYQIASSVLRKLGECELAWLAADRSMAVAQRADDPLLAGIATTRVCNALVAMGRARPALELNVQIANRLAPGGSNEVSPARLSVYGMLLLQGAMAASRIGDSASVDDLINCAEEAATPARRRPQPLLDVVRPDERRAAPGRRRGGAGRRRPGRGGAPAAHREPAFNALLPERRAHHLLDIARGYAQIGDVANAGEMLLLGDRLAPSEIRCRPIAHEVMSDILRRTRGAPPSPVAELAEHMGVGV